MRLLLILFINFILLTSLTAAMELTSPAFHNGGFIPAKYTCNGENISPQLVWGGVPPKAKSLVLIVDDFDAPMGSFIHWIVFNIPTNTTGLPEGVTSYPEGTLRGRNSHGKDSYDGPCPPTNIPEKRMHHYHFKLYALDIVLNIQPGSPKADVLSVIEGHVLELAQLIGKYEQPKSKDSKDSKK